MGDSAPGATAVPWWRRRSDVLAMLALILASFVFTSEQVAEHDMMSPIDEYQYVGYYAKVADAGIVRRGEEMPRFARRYMNCHGVRQIPEMPQNPAACAEPDSVAYPLGGGTTADLYTPLYFGATRALAQPLIWAGVDFVSAGRAAGGFWLALGAVLLYLAMRRGRTPAPMAVGLGLVMVGSLAAYWSSTYISTDATALPAGALAALITMRALDGKRGSLVLLPVAAVVATLFKFQNLIGFVAAAFVLLLVAGLAAARSDGGVASRLRAFITDRRTLSALAVVVASAAAQAGWMALRSALAVGPQVAFGFGAPLEGTHLLIELGNFLPAIGGGALSPYVTGATSLPVYTVATALAIGGAVGLTMSKGVSAEHRIVGFSTVVVAVLAAPALAFALALLNGTYVPHPSRYAMSLVPLALLSAALLVDSRRRWAQYAMLALGVVTWCLAVMMGEG